MPSKSLSATPGGIFMSVDISMKPILSPASRYKLSSASACSSESLSSNCFLNCSVMTAAISSASVMFLSSPCMISKEKSFPSFIMLFSTLPIFPLSASSCIFLTVSSCFNLSSLLILLEVILSRCLTSLARSAWS